MFRSRKLMALLGFLVGFVAGVALLYVIDFFTPPIRINYAFVVDDNALSLIRFRRWLSVIAVATTGAALGWLMATLLNRKR